MKIGQKTLYTVKCIFYSGVACLKCEESKTKNLGQCSVFLSCLLELGVPIEIYEQLGYDALSVTERERVKICQQLANGILPEINVEVFDEDTLYSILKFINKVMM